MLFVVFQNWINDRRYTFSEIKNIGILSVVCVLILLFFYVIYRSAKGRAEGILGIKTREKYADKRNSIRYT